MKRRTPQGTNTIGMGPTIGTTTTEMGSTTDVREASRVKRKQSCKEKSAEYQGIKYWKQGSERRHQVPPAKRQSEELYRIHKTMQQLVEFLRDTGQLGVAEQWANECIIHWKGTTTVTIQHTKWQEWEDCQ